MKREILVLTFLKIHFPIMCVYACAHMHTCVDANIGPVEVRGTGSPEADAHVVLGTEHQ